MTHEEARAKTRFYTNLIKTERMRQGLSQRNLAGMAGLNPSTVHLIESGKRNPTLAVLFMLFSALAIEIPEPVQPQQSDEV